MLSETNNYCTICSYHQIVHQVDLLYALIQDDSFTYDSISRFFAINDISWAMTSLYDIPKDEDAKILHMVKLKMVSSWAYTRKHILPLAAYLDSLKKTLLADNNSFRSILRSLGNEDGGSPATGLLEDHIDITALGEQIELKLLEVRYAKVYKAKMFLSFRHNVKLTDIDTSRCARTGSI